MNWLAIYLGAGVSIASYRAVLTCGLRFQPHFNPAYIAADLAIWPIIVFLNVTKNPCIKCKVLQPAAAVAGAALGLAVLGAAS